LSRTNDSAHTFRKHRAKPRTDIVADILELQLLCNGRKIVCIVILYGVDDTTQRRFIARKFFDYFGESADSGGPFRVSGRRPAKEHTCDDAPFSTHPVTNKFTSIEKILLTENVAEAVRIRSEICIYCGIE